MQGMQPLFLLMAFIFTFTIQMSEVVIERELKLRQSMATMGMLDSVHSFVSTWRTVAWLV